MCVQLEGPWGWGWQAQLSNYKLTKECRTRDHVTTMRAMLQQMIRILVKRELKMASKVAIFGARSTVT